MRLQPHDGDCVIDTQRPKRRRSRAARQHHARNLCSAASDLRVLRGGQSRSKRVPLVAIRNASAPGRSSRLPFQNENMLGSLVYASASHAPRTEIQMLNARFGRNTRRNDAVRAGHWL